MKLGYEKVLSSYMPNDKRIIRRIYYKLNFYEIDSNTTCAPDYQVQCSSFSEEEQF